MFSTKKHTSSKKSLSFIFLLFVILLGYAQTAYTQTESIYLNWDNTSTNLSKCFQQKKFKVLVQNRTGASISNATIWPTFPSGVSIVAGTIVDKTDSNSVNLNLLGSPYTSGGISWDGTKFTVTNPIPDLAVVEITFDLFANCNAANSASVSNTYLLKSNGVDQLSKTNNVTGVQTYAVSTANYSLLSPVLSIASVSNSALSNLNVGNTYVQDVAIVNGGLGEVKNMAVTIDHNATSSNTFTNLSVIDELDNIAGTATLQSNGKIVDIVLTNSLLQNKTIRLRYTVTVISCNTTSRNISVTYGCPGNVVCSTSNVVTSLNSISTLAPVLKITTTETPFSGSCGLISSVGAVTRQIKTVYENKGTSPIKLSQIIFGFMDFAGDATSISGYTENIVESSIMFTNNGGTSFAPTNIAVFGRNSYSQNIGHCSYNKATSYIMTWAAGYVILPGEKITIDYGLTQCDNSAVTDGIATGTTLDLGQFFIGSSYYAAGNIGATARFTNQCGTSINSSANAGAMYGYHMLSTYIGSSDSPPQVVGASTFQLEANFNMTVGIGNPFGGASNISNLSTAQRVLQAEIDVPNGVVYNANSLTVSSGTIASGYPQFTGNKLIVRFTDGFSIYPLVRASFTSDGIVACGKLPITYRAIAIWDNTCANPLKSSTIRRDSIEFVCPVSCPSIGPISAENKRITLGLPDNNNDGYPDATGALNMNKIYLNYVKMNDVYRSTTKYKLYTNANYIQTDHRFTMSAALLAKNSNLNLTAIGNPTIILSRGGIETTITGTIVRMSPTKNDFIIKWDDVIPSSWGTYQMDDEITVSQDYKFNTQTVYNTSGNEVSYISATFNSTTYIASAPTISDNNWTYTGPSKTSCLSLKSGIRFVSSLRPWTNSFYQNTSSICNFVEFPTTLNYDGTTFSFPFEYRNYAELDYAKFTLKPGFTYQATYGSFLAIYGGYTAASLDAFRTINGNVITYDLKAFRNSLTTPSNNNLRNYPLENQATWISIKAIPSSRCDTQANLNIDNEIKYRRIFNYSPSDQVESTVNRSVSYDFTYVLANGTAITPISQTPNSGVGNYGFKLTNPSTTGSISNLWFYLKPLGSNANYSNVKIGGIASSPNANGFYVISTLAANTFVDVTFDISLAGNCTSDNIKVYYGNECTASLIPTSFAGISCSKQLDFQINPAAASFDAQVKPLNGGAPYAFCTPFTVEFDVSSSSLGNIYDVLAKVNLANGLEYVPNSVKVKYPSSGTFTSVNYNPTITNSGKQLDFTITTSTLGEAGIISQTVLPGTANVSQNIVTVQYQVRTFCSADEGISIKHTFNANKSCGIALPSIVKQSNPVIFSDVVSFNYSMDFTRTKSDVIKNCTTGSPFHISMKNVGPSSTPSDNEISLVLPSTVQFGAYTAAGNVRNGSTLQPNDQDNGDGTHTLSWPLPSNVAQGDSIVMDVMLKPVEGLSNYPTLNAFLFVGKNILLSCDNVICDVFKLNGFKAIMLASEGGPDVPSVSITQPTCIVSTGGYTVSAPTGTGYTFSLNSGTYSSTNTVNNLNPGNYTVHVQNVNQCFNQKNITIQPQPDTAVVPTLTTIQPTCTTNTGKVIVTEPLVSEGYVFSIDGGAYSTSSQFTVNANTAAHTVSAKRTTSVCAETANSDVIISQPITLPAPGTITGINSVLPGTNQTYSINPVTSASSYLWTIPVSWTATSVLDSTSVSVTIGTNGGIVKVASISADGCISTTSNLTVTTGCRAGEVAPTFANTVQNINCGTTFDLSTLVGTNLPSNCSNCVLTFHSDSVATNLNKLSGTAITAANVGTYRAAWYDPSNDCYSNLTTEIVVKNVFPSKPIFTRTNPTCTIATGTIEITNPIGVDYTYRLNGGNYQNSPTFTSLNPGTYSITVKNNYSCTSDSSGIVISAQPITPAEPIALPVQIYTGNKTIASLSATGTSLQWFANSTGGTALASNTNLVDETTYYVSQTAANGCISSRLAVKVNRISDDSQTLCANSTVANLLTSPSVGYQSLVYSSSSSPSPLNESNILSSGTYYVEQFLPKYMTTFIGSLDGEAGGTNGLGTAATLNNPRGIAFDANGNMFVAEADGNRIRKVTPAGLVTTFAGSGIAGSANGVGTAAQFKFPQSLAFDSSGNLFVTDSGNNKIRKITPAGVVTTFAGTGIAGTTNGAGTQAQFYGPIGLAFNGLGELFVSDGSNNKIRKISPAGVVSDFVGAGVSGFQNGSGSIAQFNRPAGLVFDTNGNLFVADLFNSSIRKITPSGMVSTFAGNGNSGSTNGNGTNATFDYMTGLAIDSNNNLYTGGLHNFIRKISPSADVTTFAGKSFGFLDTLASEAKFMFSYQLAFDKVGNLYFTESNGNRIRKISPEYVSNRVPINVNIETVDKPTITVEQPVCGTPTGKITISAPLGTQYTYSLDSAPYQASTEFNTLTALSTYSIRAKSSALGCLSDTTQVTISKALLVPSNPTISSLRPLTFCTGDSTVLVSNTTIGNQWYKNGVAISGANNDTLVVHSAGVYKSMISNLDGCMSDFSDSLKVIVNSVPNVSISSVSNPGNLITICSTNSDGTTGEVVFNSEIKIGTLVQDPDDFNFQWNKNNSSISLETNPSLSTDAIGTYRLRVSNKVTGCFAFSDTIKVQNFANPNVVLSSTQVTALNYICSGQSVVIKAISSANGLEYRWKDNHASSSTSGFLSNTGVIGVADSLIHSQSYLHNVTLAVGDRPWVTSSNAGTYGLAEYSLEVKDTNGCISNQDTFQFYEALPVNKPVISGDTLGSYCADHTVILVSSQSSGNQWFKDGSALIGATNDSLIVTASGSYQVKVTSDLGCESEMSNARNVTLVALPSKPTISGDTLASYCEGNTVVISSSSINGNQWYKNGNLISGATNKDYSVTDSGIYSLKVTNSSSCTSVFSDSIEITIKPLPRAIIEQGMELAFSNCTNTPINLMAKDQLISGSTSYQWFYKSSLSGTDSTLSTTAQTHSATIAGFYYVNVTTNGCTKSSTLTRIYNPPVLNTTSTAVCSGDTVTISAVNSGIPNSVYKWFRNNLEIVGETNDTLKVFQPGTYFVQISSTSSSVSANSCPVLITVNPLPGISISGNPSNLKACSGSSVLLTSLASGSTNYAYRWIKDGSLLADTTINYSANVNGNYQVEVTDNNGCIKKSEISTIEILALPNAPTVSVLSQTNCTQSTGSIKVNSPTGSGFTYSMDGGSFQTNTTFSNVGVGVHQVKVKNSDGCVSLASNDVEILSNSGAPLLPTASVTEQPTCSLATGTIVVSAPTGTGLMYSIDSTNYQSGLTFSGVVSGTYKVRVKNSDGCVSTSTSTLTVVANAGIPSTPVASVTVQPSCTDSTGTIKFTAPLGTNFSYSIDSTNYQS
ncbi:hypothetical protein V7S79_10715, partial [Aquirufa sp. ROCK-SH2]